MSSTTERQHNDPRAAALMAFAMTVFGTIGIFRRMIPMSSVLVAFFRGAIGSLFLIFFILASKTTGRRKEHSAKETAKLVITGMLIGINWAMLFEAYEHTSVSVATLCYYMEPTFVIILSWVVLREKITPLKVACTVLALIGMVLVSGVAEPGSAGSTIISGLMSGGRMSDEAVGILLGLGAGVLYASEVIVNKTVTEFDPYHKTVIQLVSATAALVPIIVLREGLPDVKWDITLVALLITVGVVHTGLCYTIYFGSMEKLKTHTVALFSYIDPVTALIFSHIFLHEQLTYLGILGAVLIIGSAIVSSFSK